MVDDGPADPTGAAPRGARAHLRVPIDVFVRVVGADRDYPFRTRDLSEGGLFLATRVGHLYPFALGEHLVIEMHDQAQVLTLRGEVVRVVAADSQEASTYPPGFGVRLVDLTDEELVGLRELVQRRLA
jgi:hypothetical protein